MPEPTHLTLVTRQHSEALWRWSLVETRSGMEAGSGYAQTDKLARGAAHRVAGMLWPGVTVVEQKS